MALYHKALNNLEELERERKALKQQLKDIEVEGTSSFSFLNSKNEDDTHDGYSSAGVHTEEGKNIMDNIMSVAGPLLSSVVELAFPVLGTKVGKAVKKTVFKSVRNVAGNVVGGYLKWKAVELSAKALWKLANRHKKKK